jgi:hypothetical protein
MVAVHSRDPLPGLLAPRHSATGSGRERPVTFLACATDGPGGLRQQIERVLVVGDRGQRLIHVSVGSGIAPDRAAPKRDAHISRKLLPDAAAGLGGPSEAVDERHRDGCRPQPL